MTCIDFQAQPFQLKPGGPIAASNDQNLIGGPLIEVELEERGTSGSARFSAGNGAQGPWVFERLMGLALVEYTVYRRL